MLRTFIRIFKRKIPLEVELKVAEIAIQDLKSLIGKEPEGITYNFKEKYIEVFYYICGNKESIKMTFSYLKSFHNINLNKYNSL